MSTWPASLPQRPLVNGYTEQAEPTIVRSEMATGPAKVRRRFTGASTLLSVSWLMTHTQWSALETFYGDTLYDGALAFDFPHPRTGSTVSVRFLEPPSLSVASHELHQITAKLEVLP